MAHSFISYSHRDFSFVSQLLTYLQSNALPVWVDYQRLQAGEDWRQDIDDGIRQSFAVLAVMSPDAVASQYVTYEWSFAMGQGIKIIPLLIGAEKDLHPKLQVLQYLDFAKYPFEEMAPKLLERLQALQETHRPHSIPLPRTAPPIIKRSVEALDSHNTQERKEAVQSLAHTDDPLAQTILIQALNHLNADVRQQSALALATSQGELVIPALTEILEAGNKAYIKRATEILLELGNEGRSEALGSLLKSKESQYHSTAIKKLGEIGTPQAISSLYLMLQNITLYEYSPIITLLDTLKGVADKTIERDMLNLLTNSQLLIRIRALEILMEIGTQESIDPIKILLKNGQEHWEVKKIAIMVLKNIGTEESVIVLGESLKEESNYIILPELFSSIGDAGYSIGVKFLIEYLEYNAYSFTDEIIKNLGKINDIESIQSLKDIYKAIENHRIAHYEYSYLIRLILDSLTKIGTQEALEIIQYIESNHQSNFLTF